MTPTISKNIGMLRTMKLLSLLMKLNLKTVPKDLKLDTSCYEYRWVNQPDHWVCPEYAGSIEVMLEGILESGIDNDIK